MYDTCEAGNHRTAVLLIGTVHQLATTDPGLRLSHRVELHFCTEHHEPVDRLQVGPHGPHCWAHRTDLARLIFEGFAPAGWHHADPIGPELTADVRESIRGLAEYLADTEREDWEENGGPDTHIYNDVVRVLAWLEATEEDDDGPDR